MTVVIIVGIFDLQRFRTGWQAEELLAQKAQALGRDRPLQCVILLLSLSFICAIGYYGAKLAPSPGIMRQRFSTMPFSMAWVYACIPVSAVLIGIQLLNLLANTVLPKGNAQ